MNQIEVLQALVEGRTLQVETMSGYSDLTTKQVLRALLDEPKVTWRIKPDMVKINGFDVPAPVRETLDRNTSYYCERPDIVAMYMDHMWEHDSSDTMWLARGILHLTKENAVASCRARLGIDPYKD